ncbi:BAG family molecular chaperone regulator 8, chloroplastic [Cocos nucifera]|uniref:BAG family molecular chaperone regulator 8, chloroplastic n=1 Tax=Cocos nucifera TaxID=13894 RepID=A0A8K0IVT7_COCNU|nr:BAG family molecular chaperone regulator 8, chloroplastic [Cocos nucifera]
MPSPHRQCSCSCCSCFSSSAPSPPRFSPSDQLLQALTTQLLLYSQSPSPPHIYSHQSLKSHNPSYRTPYPTQEQQQQYPSQTHLLLHSLLSRVAALESSVAHLSSPSSRSPPPPPRSSPASRPPSSSLSSRPSLRDAAARTIQARFRLFLVRRSQTLRYLKCLASIKSHAATLRSSLSDHTACRDPKALSERATGLLLQLDSIQSGDPMIREGKRSISRELGRILEFVEKVLVKEHERSLGAAEVAGIGGNGNEGSGEIEMLLRSNKPTLKVSFFENGRESRVSAGALGPFPEHFEERSNGGHQRANIERLCREVTGTRIAEHSEPEEGVSQLSDDERSSEGGSENGGNFRGRNGNLGGLSAPLPLLMERRRRER